MNFFCQSVDPPFVVKLKRGYHGTFHHFSRKHTNRYVTRFAARPHSYQSSKTELEEPIQIDVTPEELARVVLEPFRIGEILFCVVVSYSGSKE